MLCVKNELLFNNIEIDRANIARLIYLSTFIDYNNRQENLLIKHGKGYKIEPMSRTDIKKVLKLSDTAFKAFLSDLKANNLLFESNGKYYISQDYFSRGKSNFKDKEYTRIYIDTTRFLYENCTSRQHKQLSYIFQLVPFMHYELNILCDNPLEPDVYKLKKLNLTNICEMLGLSTARPNLVKFKNDIIKFYITIDGEKYYFFTYVLLNTINNVGIRDYFVVNPKIVWGGKDTDVVKDTIQACFFK